MRRITAPRCSYHACALIVHDPAQAPFRQALINALFDIFDEDEDGVLNKAEYQSFLDGIDVWGTYSYNASNYDEKWPTEMEVLGTSSQDGMDRTAFTILYTLYRGTDLQSDYALVPKVRL